MSLLNAPEYDERRAKRRLLLVWTAIAIVIVLAATAFFARNWTYERIINRFFTAIEHQDYEAAFAIYTADPDWKSHPQKYSNYPFGQFSLDWGPGGDWGAIREHHINCASQIGTGVIVAVTINGRPEPAYMWVEKKDHTLTVAPSHLQLQCNNLFGK